MEKSRRAEIEERRARIEAATEWLAGLLSDRRCDHDRGH